MEPVTLANLEAFFEQVGKRYHDTASLYLLGGSALALLGSPRTTVDVDYTFELGTEAVEEFEAVLTALSTEMRLDLDPVPLAEFIPLPPQAHKRRQLVGTFGQVEVYIFDPYSIALSKIARGFEADLEDVTFMLNKGLIEFGELERYFITILPDAPQADIIPSEFQTYFEEIRRRVQTKG